MILVKAVTPIFYSRSEGKTFELFGLLEDVVRIQIGAEPHQNNYRKYDKARAVFHCRKEGNQEYPEGRIISNPNNGDWERIHLFDGYVVS
jgi:hypothetical protein